MKLVDLPGPEWNMYDISCDNPEHDLFNSLVVEQNDIMGAEIYYYRIAGVENLDRLYGENPNTYWHSFKKTRAIYEPTEEVSVVESFGITSDESISYMFIPKYTFSRDVVGDITDTTTLPIPGDVIHTVWNDKNYEVVDVGLEANIFQFGKFIYELILKPFRFSDQYVEDPDAVLAKDITDAAPLSAWGDNEWIENISDSLSAYGDVDEHIYGY